MVEGKQRRENIERRNMGMKYRSPKGFAIAWVYLPPGITTPRVKDELPNQTQHQ